MPAIMTMLADHAARQLLDFSQKLDINLLDSVVNCLYHGEGPQQRMAQEVLTHLKEHPDAWTRVDTILEFSQNMNTKYYALQILETVIKTRWKILPRNQCEGIKKYVVGLIIKTSSDATNVEKEKVYIGKLNMILVQILKQEWPKHWPTFISDIVGASRTSESLCQNNMIILKLLSEEVFDFSSGQMTQKEKVYIGKLNMILVQILKQEWPKHWPTFISDIVGASRTSESLCQNNMIILKLLSEEVFDFSSGQMTQVKAKHLKDSMCNEFSQIFQLCQFVMENSQNAPLVHATLETLLRFLNWIPLGYIFETKLISTLVYKFLNVPMFRNVTLKCLTEIAGVSVSQYEEQFVTLFTLTMMQLKQYYALQILETVIKTRWKILPRNQCEGIKKYVVGLIIKTSSDATNVEKEKVYIGKLNMILVQILKQEWPKHWPTFISDIVGASRTSESLCQNNMIILKLLSEEVFDFSSGQMTQKEKVYIGKLNMILVQILKQEWPKHWPTFISDIVGASRTSESLCQNNMIILKLLSEEVFDFSSGQMTQVKAKHLKDSMCNEFSQIFQLCQFVMALHYMLLVSEVEETEIFKICLEYWNHLAAELYRESPFSTSTSPLLSGSQHFDVPPRRQLYLPVLSKGRLLMVSRMAKPEEVLVVENDQGEVVREFMKDTDSINLYKNMRETLVYLTHLDYADTERIMTEKLHNQVNGTEWSWKNLNTLCWAIGSISGAMHEEDEKRFLVTVIKDLLGLCEQKRGKDNKAIIASNIMYIVGQYPRFLRAHWKFLKTVVNKLFEFMHETHDGVQDMACDTFIKIAQKCRRHFVQVQVGEVMPFIDEILNNINTIICDLQPQQVHTFYEAVGYMIGAQTDQTVQEHLIEKYMLLPNQVWDSIIQQATKNVDILKDPETVKQLGSILKTNVRACKAVGHPFLIQLGRIYLDMLNVYKCLSENISAAIQTNVLIDYQRNVPAAREPEVLSTMATIVNKLGGHITAEIPQIFDAVFECTLNMINKDFEEYPEHRTNFFLLLQAVNLHCFPAFLAIPPAQFKLVLDSIIWAFKHTMRNVADTGLQILYTLLQNVAQEEAAAQSFYQTYFCEILQHIFSVVTDTSHTAGLQILYTLLQNVAQEEAAAQSFYQTYFCEILQHIFSVVTDTSHTAGLTMHASILTYMFNLVEEGKINAALNPATPVNNQMFIQEYVANLLKSAFPHLQDAQVKVFVTGLFSLNQDIPAFKEHLRDFLVQIKEFAGEDTTDLFLEERESSLRQAQEEKHKLQMSVPGILNPHEIPEEMCD
ncbi:UNVERIFIED_CONTAM: hypothetical protein FKN15_017488 [Acipenser sinensis]